MSETYYNFLEEKQTELLHAIRIFKGVFVLENRQEKIATARSVEECLSIIKKSIATKDIPEWLNELLTAFTRYLHGSDGGRGAELLLRKIAEYESDCRKHKWRDSMGEERVIVFNEVTDREYRNTRMPELFESLATQIERVIKEDHIDSQKAIKKLKSLIRLIRRNASTSWLSAQFLLPFSFKVVKHVFTEVVKDKLGPAAEGISKAIQEMNEEWPIACKQVNDAVARQIPDSLHVIDYAPSDEVIDVDSVLRSLHGPSGFIEDKREQPPKE
jgi:hypothetical protein